jgi:serine/threonine protein kinase
VKSFSCAYDGQYLYLIMEFMEGETLGQELRTELLRSMSEQSAAKAKINESVTSQISRINKIRKVLFEIAGGVAYLHEKGLVHRDVKPDNVFISHVQTPLPRTPTNSEISGVRRGWARWSTSALSTTLPPKSSPNCPTTRK